MLLNLRDALEAGAKFTDRNVDAADLHSLCNATLEMLSEIIQRGSYGVLELRSRKRNEFEMALVKPGEPRGTLSDLAKLIDDGTNKP